MTYNEVTRWHFETARQAGELSGSGTQRGAAGSRATGIWVQFDVQRDDGFECGAGAARAVVRAVKFRAYGCPHVIAVADWLAQQALGRDAQPGLPVSIVALQQRFGVPVEKVGRLLIVEDAWIAAFAPPSRPSLV